MTDFIICIATNLFRIYLISRFIHIFLQKKDDDYHARLRHMLAYVFFFTVNTTTYLAFHTAVINFICNLAGIGLIAFTYTKSIKMILFLTCSIYMINMGCDTISTFMFVDYKDGFGFSQIYEVVTVFLIFICELLTERIVDARQSAPNIRNVSLVLVPLSSVGMFYSLIHTGSSTETGFVITSVGLILINFFVFYLYNIQSDILFHQYENEALRQKIQGYANQIDVMLQGEEKVKTLRHDMKHHLNELKILASKGEGKAIETYISDMEEFMANPSELVSSGNLETDSLVNYMLRRAKEELCSVQINMHLPKSMDHSFDVNVILGNLLENAIEAAKQTEEKSLDVNIEQRQGFLRIQVENSYNGKLEKRNQKLLTTKKAQGLHGIGLENVRKIVEKYNGIMEIYPDKDTFRVALMLYMAEVKK